MYAIGIDIGGTKVAVGIVDAAGQLHSQTIIPTDLERSPREMIEEIIETVEQLIQQSHIPLEQLVGIGIGAPGPLDAKKGCITCPPNLPRWIHVPIVEWFKERFSFPVFLENDANAAALAEKWVGSAKESEHFIYLTISTGIGAGLYLDGKLFTGARGNAGDIGHIVIDPSYGKCTCGQKGCLEWIASGTAIARRGSEIMGTPLSTKEVFQLYQQGEPKIVPFIHEVFNAIGVGCVTLINLFDPEKIVIGGGVSEVGAPLFEAVQSYIHSYALNPDGCKIQVVPASLRQHAGVIGAAAVFFKKKGEKQHDLSC
jgi:glucokinase